MVEDTPAGYLDSVLNVAIPVESTVAVGARRRGFTMTTAMYAVEGMMCDSCMAAVQEKVQSLSGVTVVVMDLVAGGRSPLIVSSATRLGAEAVRGAVERVGFGVLHPKGPEVGDRGNGPATQARDTHPGRQPVMSSIGGLSS
jgi:copper chaperone CopZ